MPQHVENSGSTTVKIALFLLLLSFVIRAVLLTLVSVNDVPLVYDENAYYSRSVGFKDALEGVFTGHSLSASDLGDAYGGGEWPPMHPFLLSMGLIAFGDNVDGARWMVLLISSLTTVLVYLLSLRLSTTRTAVAAALIHIFYPSFVAFSHYLWAETAYILFVLGGVYFVVLAAEAPTLRKVILFSGLAGCLLGLAGLTRAAMLPLLAVFPLALFFYSKKGPRRIVGSAVIVVSCVIVLAPWQFVIMKAEGGFAPLSTQGGYNLYLGNNPWIPEGFGSSWGHPESIARMKQTAGEYSEFHDVSLNKAESALAVEHIMKDKTGFLRRAVHKSRLFWAGDFFAIRHVLHAVYPPMSYSAVAIIWSIILLSYGVFVALTMLGFLGAAAPVRYRGLILALVAAGMALSAVTISMSRLHIPALAFLLPVAGAGLANIGIRRPFKRLFSALALFVLFVLFILPSFRVVVEQHLRPSSYYAGLVNPIARLLGSRTQFVDQVVLKKKGTDSSDTFTVVISSDEYWFHGSGLQVCHLGAGQDSLRMELDIISRCPQKPLEFTFNSKTTGQSSMIRPIDDRHFRKWQPTGLSNAEFMWFGGGARPKVKEKTD